MRRSVLAVMVAAVAVVFAVQPAQAVSPRISANDLNKCGFTIKPNISAWQGGSANMAPTGKVPAGRNIVIQGKAASALPDGTKLQLLRFASAKKGCHGSFQPIGSGIYTTVRGGQYYLNFQLDRQGTFGYAIQAVSGGNTYEIEFRLTTK